MNHRLFHVLTRPPEIPGKTKKERKKISVYAQLFAEMSVVSGNRKTFKVCIMLQKADENTNLLGSLKLNVQN